MPLSQSVGEGKISAISLSYLVDNQDQAVIWRGPKKTAMIKQFLQDVCWGKLDFLLIDTPPGKFHTNVLWKFLTSIKLSIQVLIG